MDWKKLLSKFAPGLAGMLPGPFGTVAKELLTKALKVDAQTADDALAARLTNPTAADIVAIKSAELDAQKLIATTALEFERLAVSDRADARAREKSLKDWVPASLALTNAAAFFTLLGMLLTHTLPEANKTAFDILLGMLGSNLLTVMTYYFGSSSGSSAKDATIHELSKG